MQPSPEPAFFPTLPPSPRHRLGLHILLFLLTAVTTTLAGAELATGGYWTWDAHEPAALGWEHLPAGLPYMGAFLWFITFHEFGHWLMARWHGVRTSLPYYIPLFIPGGLALNIGSLGAVIRIRQMPRTTIQFFDIGIAGPLAGLLPALLLLIIGFLTLPDQPAHLLPHTQQTPVTEGEAVLAPRLGKNLLFVALEYLLADPVRMPDAYNIFHYPLLFMGYLSLFFTALNLLPIGQLDGGHVTYGLLGARRAGVVSRVTILLLLTYGGLGVLDFAGGEVSITGLLYLVFVLFSCWKLMGSRRHLLSLGLGVLVILAQQVLQGIPGIPQENYIWLVYAFMALTFIRPDHPRAMWEYPLNPARRRLGWATLLIFVLCFSPNPISIDVLPPGSELYFTHLFP
ncbi:MAG: site-2 protease family protein [Bacteroidetes bacterium]|nr:site-2 protease family protein [Bacteroidota bacterium]